MSAPPRDPASVLILSRYGSLGASSRVRMFEYLPWIRACGLRVEVQSLLSDSYLKRKYGGGRIHIGSLAAAYMARLNFLLAHLRPAVIWLEKELWPFVPFGVERLFLAGRRFVVDIDDAIFHDYDEHRSFAVRRIFAHKFDGIFRGARLVTAGSSYLAKRAVASNAPWVELLPTVVSFGRYQSKRITKDQEFTVGWIGSPATQHLLLPVIDVLAEELNVVGSRFVTIGSALKGKLFERHEEWPWKEDTEAQQLSQLDLGIMPLQDRPFERGKCGYKLIQYMACGVPVVASPVGANSEIVRHGENGFLAQTKDEWRSAIAMLRGDADLRRRMGEAGRAMVKERYSLEVTGPRLAQWLASIANGATESP